MEIEPENWQAVLAFVACETQWRYRNSGRLIGIDYPALESVMRMQAVADMADVFYRVRILETEALKIINQA